MEGGLFEPINGNEDLHKTNNVNGLRVVSFATLKTLIIKSTSFPHRDIHKHTWTLPDVSYNQIHRVLIDKI
jgi:hypothetical protein